MARVLAAASLVASGSSSSRGRPFKTTRIKVGRTPLKSIAASDPQRSKAPLTPREARQDDGMLCSSSTPAYHRMDEEHADPLVGLVRRCAGQHPPHPRHEPRTLDRIKRRGSGALRLERQHRLVRAKRKGRRQGHRLPLKLHENARREEPARGDSMKSIAARAHFGREARTRLARLVLLLAARRCPTSSGWSNHHPT